MAVLPKAQTVIVNSVQGQEDGDSMNGNDDMEVFLISEDANVR